jgi:hypothetical protein
MNSYRSPNPRENSIEKYTSPDKDSGQLTERNQHSEKKKNINK